MGRAIGGGIFAVALVLAACGSSSKTIPREQDGTCEAGARRCVGLNVKVCSDDGSVETIEETCLPSQTCNEGACAETSCIPNTKFCKDASIYKCDSTGGGSQLKETCPTGKFCVEDDGDADCSDVACTAGEALCDGTVATTCAADGSGPKPGGKDCAANDQSCVAGSCLDRTCEPGTKTCQHDDVYVCSSNGTQVDLLAECASDEACDADVTACRPRICEPGKIDCDESRVVACNDYGTAWKQAGEDCASENKICVAGTCKQQTCTAYATFCRDGDVHQCDSLGISSKLYQECAADFYHCQPYPSGNFATCAYDECQPGQTLCDGNTIKVCTENATLPATGTHCGDDQYCEDGECKPRVCPPYEYYCKEGNIYYCDSFGGPPPGEQPTLVCPSDTACKKIEQGVACVALPCAPGAAACVGNQVGTCAADGSKLSKVTDDCAASGSICGPDAQCAKTAEDVVGVAESAEVDAAGELMGNVFEVTAARKLTEIEINLVLASPRELRWVIYEQSGPTFIARFDKVLSNQSGTGFASSGPLSYGLKAGKRYAVGVVVTGGDAVSYYDAAPWAPQVSFGTTLGYIHTYYSAQVAADYAYADRLYQMRVTTEAP